MAFGQGQGPSSPQTVTVQSAGKQVLFGSLDRRKAILVLGLGLFVMVNWGGAAGDLWGAATGGQYHYHGAATSGKAMGAELALLAALFLISFAGDDAANASVLVLLGLWAVWWINRNALAPSSAASSAASSGQQNGPISHGRGGSMN